MASPDELDTYAHQLRYLWHLEGPNKRVSDGDLEFADLVISGSVDHATRGILSSAGKIAQPSGVRTALRRVFTGKGKRIKDEPTSELFPAGWSKSPRAVKSFLQLWRRERWLYHHKGVKVLGSGNISDDEDAMSERSYNLDIWRGFGDNGAWDDGWVEDENLCAICGNRSFKRFFLQSFEFDDGYHFHTRTLAHVKTFARSCKFCRLTLIALGLEKNQEIQSGDETFQVRSDDPVDSGSLKARDGGRVQGIYNLYKKKGKIAFYLLPDGAEKPTNREGVAFASATHNFQVCLPDTQDAAKTLRAGYGKNEVFSGRLMQQDINLDLLRYWVETSNSKRPSQSLGSEGVDIVPLPGRKFQPIRLIDVNNGNIVTSSAPVEFVALSYVWGNWNQLRLILQNQQELHTPNWLDQNRSKLGHTILDAIDLCQELSFQYLWVDSLCIIQDDPKDQAEQIAQMDLIYRSASLTIVQASSASETNANTPLPGFRPGTRSFRQEEAVIQGQKILLTCRRPFSLAVQGSKWFTRAWTLQELLLSRRLLYFTDHQVFLADSEGFFFCEDTVFECERDDVLAYCASGISTQHIDWDYNPFTMNIHESAAEAFLYIISQYTGRMLSHQTDALRAIYAIQQNFSKELGTAPWGLADTIFDYMLCWSPSSPRALERRECFPSWSWAGWRGGICFLHEMDPRRSRTGALWAGKPLIPDFRGFTVRGRDSDVGPMIPSGTYAEQDQSQNNDVGKITCPVAMTIGQIEEYYRNLLGHEPRLSPLIKDGSHLYITTSVCTLPIGNTECPVRTGDENRPSHKEGRGRRESRHAGTFYNLVLPSSISHNFPTSIAMNKGWRQSQAADVIEIDFIAVKTNVVWKVEPDERPRKSPRRPKSPETFAYLNLVPVEWSMRRACDDCDVLHRVAARIGNVGVVSLNWDACISDWRGLGAKDGLVVFT